MGVVLASYRLGMQGYRGVWGWQLAPLGSFQHHLSCKCVHVHACVCVYTCVIACRAGPNWGGRRQSSCFLWL